MGWIETGELRAGDKSLKLFACKAGEHEVGVRMSRVWCATVETNRLHTCYHAGCYNRSFVLRTFAGRDNFWIDNWTLMFVC